MAREPYFFTEIFSFDKNIFNLEGGLQLQIYNQSYAGSNEKIITVALVNMNFGGDFNQTAKLCAFQPTIKVECCDGREIFSDINLQKNIGFNPELLELDMLYSDIKCYAQGHGCAAIWDNDNAAPRWISSSFMPKFNLRQMKAAEFGNTEVLSMKFLYTAPLEKIVRSLKNFLGEYQNWIENLKAQISNVKENLKGVAVDNIKKCQQACDRILNSIELLEKNSLAFRAFQLANEAMFLQRRQTVFKAKKFFDEKKYPLVSFPVGFYFARIAVIY